MEVFVFWEALKMPPIRIASNPSQNTQIRIAWRLENSDGRCSFQVMIWQLWKLNMLNKLQDLRHHKNLLIPCLWTIYIELIWSPFWSCLSVESLQGPKTSPLISNILNLSALNASNARRNSQHWYNTQLAVKICIGMNSLQKSGWFLLILVI